ncbi:hypothetical protein F5B20DRAFT_45229 [Whalleya microplaca]|nr:hypothetical protein F5B20DRAFT_45229 [Whalleya microplaca]
MDAFHDLQSVRREPSFQLFSELPCELRHKIWGFSLQQNRLITVCLTQPNEHSDPPYTMTNTLGRIVSGNKYRTIVYQAPRCHSLLGVNSEARYEALRFYRVRLPCFQRRARIDRPPLDIARELYFNPEYDYMHLDDGDDCLTFMDDAVPYFLNDIRAYDPRKFGILHLVLSSLDAWKPFDVIPQVLEGFKGALKNLQSLWASSSGTVQMLGGMANRSWARQSLSAEITSPLPFRLGLFAQLKVDQVGSFRYVIKKSHDPRHMIMDWQQLERDLEIHRDRPVDFRCFFHPAHVVWKNLINTPMPAGYGSYQMNRTSESSGNHLRVSVPHLSPPKRVSSRLLQSGSAIGFWLFPIEISAQVPAARDELCIFKVPMYVSDTVHSKPDICVFKLDDV